MATEKAARGFKTFTIIWVGQLVSLLGSAMTAFALGVWILHHTQSVTQFALVIVIAGLPGILISPLVGALVDRWNRRRVLLLTDLGAALVTLAIALLFRADLLQVWHIYVAVAINSVFSTFQWPAFSASITLLVKKEQFARINGMLQFGQAGTSIAGPALAGALWMLIELWGIILIDFATFLFAFVTLLIVHIPQPRVSAEGAAGRGSLMKEAAYGWVFIKQRPGLIRLLLFFAAINLVICLCGTALLPMVLSFASEAGVGTVMGLVGVGTLAGGLIMTVTGGTKRRIVGVLTAPLIFAVGFVLVGLRPSLLLVSVGVVVWYLGLPILNASSQAIWQAKVAPDVQGRVFAMRRMIAQFTVPIGDFLAGPMSDYIFLPLLVTGGLLAGSVGRVVGVGPGRGIGFMFIVASVFLVLISLLGFLNGRLRQIEDELPDAVGDEPESASDEPEQESTADEAAAGE